MSGLPEEFTARMEGFLGDEADAFFSCYERPRTHGLRVNPLKCDSSFSQNLPFPTIPIPWARDSFYVPPESLCGRHPLHHAGAYYIQEPSAMAPVSLLDVHPGDMVCDLCAAPGGKATQIAGNLNGRGLLVANEVVPNRAKVLSQNVERLGVTNCVVCSETPQRMPALFPQWFDKVLVDAPCSGEGMFRKEENSIKEWSVSQIARCAQRQKEILDCADRMLAPGGVLVYSTCTFAPEEDEQMVAWFLREHPDYTVEDWRAFLNDFCGIRRSELSLSESSEKNAQSAFLTEYFGIEGGRPQFLTKEQRGFLGGNVDGMMRMFPHKVRGEGHFAARLKKGGETGGKVKRARAGKGPACDLSSFRAFCAETLVSAETQVGDLTLANLGANPHRVSKALRQANPRQFQFFGDTLYLVPAEMIDLDGIRVVRAGLELGTQKKGRFEPAHALAMALDPAEAVREVPCDLETAKLYLRGETLPCDEHLSGWTLVTFRGITLGWGKAKDGVLKNHYPKGLRTV